MRHVELVGVVAEVAMQTCRRVALQVIRETIGPVREQPQIDAWRRGVERQAFGSRP
jgi:hypothetical protein